MKAISRNEKYLSKLSGEEEVVPKPISRKEKYMYRACGYIDKPIPGHAISREEKYWKKIIENGGGGSAVLTSKDITENGLYNAADDEADGYSSVNVDVPNTYLLSDEGKVVSNGDLVSQTSTVVSQNGVVDTTLIDSVNVNVPNINNILFAPPQKFKSNGSNLLDYKIYGNNTPHIAQQTSVLPLTFTAKGGTAADWVIYGNDEAGTENLLKITAESQTVNNVQITINADKTVTVNGTASENIYFDLSTISISQGTYTLSSGGTGITSDGKAVIYAYDGTYHICSPYDKTWALSETKNVSFVVWISSGTTVDNLTFKPMFVQGSTAPDHFIPYQQGVGERTENLFNINASTLVPINEGEYRFGVSLGKLDVGDYVLSFVSSSAYTLYITKRTGTSYTQSSTILTSPFTFSVDDSVDEVYLRTTRRQEGTPSTWADMGFTDIIINAGSSVPSTYVPYGYEIPISVNTPNIYDEANIQQGTVHEGSSVGSSYATVTSPPYPPNRLVTSQPVQSYGMTIECDFTKYRLFLAFFDSNKEYLGVYSPDWILSKTLVDNANYKYMAIAIRKIDNSDISPSEISDVKLKVYKHINDYTFYIGSTPLTAGQSISKTSTGVDIELFEGENTVSTTLYNKPSMSIEGVDYVGVGKPINDSWQIPVKINSTTTNVPIDAPLVENEYVSYIDQKIYHYIDGTLTPVDPPSTLPHIATANGVNELSIDVEVQPELVGIGLGNPIELVNT